MAGQASKTGTVTKDINFCDANDIGNFIGIPIDQVSRSLIDKIWKPSENFLFPAQETSKRRFKYHWLLRYPWLAYSKRFDGAFCICCTLFGKSSDQQLCQVPFRDWKNAMSKFSKHNDKSPQHKVLSATMSDFLMTSRNASLKVSTQLDNQYKTNVAKNRKIIESMIRILFQNM